VDREGLLRTRTLAEETQQETKHRQDGGISRVGDSALFHRQHFSLQSAETEESVIKADASESFVEWVLYVHVGDRSRSPEVVVHNRAGAPFRTSGCLRQHFEEVWGTGVMASRGEPLRHVDPARGC
jgi:hypothetical protein